MNKYGVAFAHTLAAGISSACTPEELAGFATYLAKIPNPKNCNVTRIALNDPRRDSTGNPIDSSLPLDLAFDKDGAQKALGYSRTAPAFDFHLGQK